MLKILSSALDWTDLMSAIGGSVWLVIVVHTVLDLVNGRIARDLFTRYEPPAKAA